MIKRILNILCIAFPILVSAQKDFDPISKITYSDSLLTISIKTIYQSNWYYYYVNKQIISWTNAFICPESILSIGFLDSSQSEKLFGPELNGTVIILETKPNFELVSLSTLLKRNNIDFESIHYSEVYINDQPVLDSASSVNALFDSKVEVKPLYRKEMCSGLLDKEPIGALIYTKHKF